MSTTNHGSPVPPASAPAATPEPERCRIVRTAGVCNELTVAWVEWFADRTRQRLCAAHADHVQKAELGTIEWDGPPAAPTDEEAETEGCWAFDCETASAVEAELQKAGIRKHPDEGSYSPEEWARRVIEAVRESERDAQATALAALRARETELTAALVRVMAWNDVGFHDNGLPPLIVQDIRAALAPRQPTGDQP